MATGARAETAAVVPVGAAARSGPGGPGAVAGPAADGTVSKGEFARARGVTPGRVSQWIAEGKIRGDALAGEGRRARIRSAIAVEQLRQALHHGQMTGNGLTTRLDSGAEEADCGAGRAEAEAALPESAPPAAEPPRAPSIEDRIKVERLRHFEAQTRRLLEEERARLGRYTLTAHHKTEVARAVAQLMKIVEGGLADMASALAARFELPQRDVLHALRGAFREVRATAARSLKVEAEAMDRFVENGERTAGEAREDGNSTCECPPGGNPGTGGGD